MGQVSHFQLWILAINMASCGYHKDYLCKHKNIICQCVKCWRWIPCPGRRENISESMLTEVYCKQHGECVHGEKYFCKCSICWLSHYRPCMYVKYARKTDSLDEEASEYEWECEDCAICEHRRFTCECVQCWPFLHQCTSKIKYKRRKPKPQPIA
jgi:hypothetical protein